MPRTKKRSDKVAPLTLSVRFKLVFITCVLLTGVSLSLTVGLSFVGDPNQLQIELFQTCSETWKIGFGIILGLIGGKAS